MKCQRCSGAHLKGSNYMTLYSVIKNCSSTFIHFIEEHFLLPTWETPAQTVIRSLLVDGVLHHENRGLNLRWGEVSLSGDCSRFVTVNCWHDLLLPGTRQGFVHYGIWLRRPSHLHSQKDKRPAWLCRWRCMYVITNIHLRIFLSNCFIWLMNNVFLLSFTTPGCEIRTTLAWKCRT